MGDSIYCYENTDILKNKFNIKNQDELFKKERKASAMRLAQLEVSPISGNFDLEHLQKIHQHIFQDIYDWAGEIRTVNIAKGNFFCLCEHIQSYSNEVFENFYSDCIKNKDNIDKFAETLTVNFSNLNALHPFREGNGRCQREFLRELCLDCGYNLNINISADEMIEASIDGFYCNFDKLINIFRKSLKSTTPRLEVQCNIDNNTTLENIYEL